jgi:ABC-type polysaccharide/polyol phosphate transport system ATPase subunit
VISLTELPIVVSNVWKKYKIFHDKPTTLKERLLYRSKGVFHENWVLNDVSLNIEKGKMIGLIGRNGSGKSTLLKILTRILMPDKGNIIIQGRVSSLLELGAGFHMDFTGRENIFMNASIFGLNRKEITEILPEIIRFSELGEYIDNPVRTYSSGMYMRLAFAIAVHVEPDVLLIDEILAVGDNAFQKKCISRIEEFKGQGKTIVFVSHDNGTVERLCDEVYWLHNAKVFEHGKPREVIRNYLDFLAEEENERLSMESSNSLTVKQEDNYEIKPTEINEPESQKWGDGSITISNVVCTNESGQVKHIFTKGKPMNIEFDCINHNSPSKPVFGIGIFKMDGTSVYGTNTLIDNLHFDKLLNREKVIFSIDSLNLVQGQYYIDVACHHEDGTPYDYRTKVLTFQVHSLEEDIGIAYLSHTWALKGVENNE